MKMIFTPVISKLGKYDWWTGSTGFYYKYGLLSAGDSTNGLVSEDTFQKPEGFILLADSGGFQTVTQRRSFVPETIAEWQDRMNSDIKFILDYPPIERTPTGFSSTVLHGEGFRNKLALTEDASRRMVAAYTKGGDVYGVLHGNNIEELISWRDTLMKVHDFKGWGLKVGIKGVDPLEKKIKMLAEIGVNRIHLFGVTNFMHIIMVAKYMRQYKIENCTFDSTRFIATKFSNVYYPVMGNIVTWFRREEKKPDMRMACDCPVCQTLKPNSFLDANDDVTFGYISSLHNIYHFNRFAEAVVEVSKYEETLEKLRYRYSNIHGAEFIEGIATLQSFAKGD